MLNAFLEEEVPYIIERDGQYYFGVAQLDGNSEVVALHLAEQNKVLHVEDFDESFNEDICAFTYVNPTDESYTYHVWPMNLSNFKKFFPRQIRTFKNDFDLQNFIRRNVKGPYMAIDPDFMYAVTVEDGKEGSREVLELLRMNEEGEMEYRQSGQWVSVEGNGDYPTIYDKHMIFIANEDESTIVELFDSKEHEDSFAESEITDYAALV